MYNLLQDLPFALRTLARRRAFTAVAIATIALGVGAATSIYSVVDGVLFRPLAFREPGRLVAVWQTFPQWLKEPILKGRWDRIPLSIPEYRDWAAEQRSFEHVAIWAGAGAMLGGGDTPEQVPLLQASTSLLSVLGARPVLGRYILPGDDVVGSAPVAVVSHEAWMTRHAGDPRILGRTVTLDDTAYTIIGVLPRGLKVGREEAPPYWVPVGRDPSDANERGDRSYTALGRLKAGVPMEQAAREADRILRGSEDRTRRGVRLAEWQVDQTRDVRAPLLVLLAAVGLLLVIACVNVATLLLGEAAAREHEMGTRIALGASRGRLVRQLLTESLVLAALGAAVGSLLAWWGTKALVALAPPRIPGIQDVRMDARVLAFALAAAAGTGLLFGIVPALTLSRQRSASLLRLGAGQSGRGRGTLQRALVGAEFALSVVLLVGAGLLSRSLLKVTAVDPGFRTDRLLVVRVALPRTEYADSTARREFYRAAHERLAALPEVEGVTASTTAPFGGGSSSSSIEIEGRLTGPGEQSHEAQQRTTLPDYFRTMGVPLLAGRTYTDADRPGAPLVVVISEALARRDWPTESALGKRVKFQGEWRTVIGIVGDVKFRKLSGDDEATIYAPLAQRAVSGLALLVRTRGRAATAVPAVRAALREVAPGAAVTAADEMTGLVARSFAEERYRTVLISLFGVMAALLAAVGMYGVTARAVSRQTREIGIRLALGATTWRVARLIVGHTLSGVAIGVVLGALGAAATAKLLAPYLFGVRSTDPATYAAALGLLGVASVAASVLPARRAARVEPAVVLRGE
ncbi:MAG: ABC transporter permease [Gemmatimonadaceae bacterium]